MKAREPSPADSPDHDGFQEGLRHTSAALVMATVDREPGEPVLSVLAANPAAYSLTRSRTAGELETAVSHAMEQAAARGEAPRGWIANRFQFEHALDIGEGAVVHLMIEVSAVGSSGDGSGRVIIYLKDITADKTLQRQMEWLSALPEANPNIVLIMSCPDRLDYVNPTGRAWLESHSTASPVALRALLPAEFGRAVCQGCDRTERRSWIIRHEEREYDVRKSPLPDRSRCMITINDVTELRLEVYQTIADLAELRDNETGNHIKRVGRYAMELARRMGHSRHFQEELLNFAPLHDIGKLGIPDGILLAPRQLTAEETGIMRRHTILGHEIFRNRPSLETAASIALGHHERWDGTGYPHGLAGGENSLCARIVAVCDVYDALRSERPYKGPWTHEEALRAIREGRGTQFDPEVVDAFLDCHECIEGVHATLPDT